MKLRDLSGIHDRIAKDAGLARAKVECTTCGASQEVDGAACLRSGWPECCGYTMRLITPPREAE